MPRYDAFALKGWEQTGITRLVVARTRENGWLQVGAFLVDVFCLGVKDAFEVEVPAHDWPDKLERMLPAAERIAMHPACARRFVEEAAAYAEAIGFAPHRDYKKARRVFGSVCASDCPQTFTFGERGKPLYIAGPNDDTERIDRILRTLTARLGPDGFHYILPLDPDASDAGVNLDETLRKSLQLFFVALRREADRHVLGGLCAAACIDPADLQPEDLIPVLWGESPPTSWTGEDETRLSQLITEYWDGTEERLDQAGDAGRPGDVPHFVDELWQSEAEVGIVAGLWCRGFMRAVAAWPAAWAGVRERAELRPHLEIIAAIAGDPPGISRLAPPPANDLAEAIGVAVLAIRAGLPPLTGHVAPASAD